VGIYAVLALVLLWPLLRKLRRQDAQRAVDEQQSVEETTSQRG
jgi:hypothetical protein